MNGNAHAASPRYIYGDVGVDARMWYQESTETIKSTIDGMTATHASATNPERVVKYMIVQGHRYQGNSLIDLRIKDINVKVDLNAENPNAPEPGELVEYDGTTDSIFQKNRKTGTNRYSEASESVSIYWTGPWPVLHVLIQTPYSPLCVAAMHLTVDLIGKFTLISAESNYFGLQTMSVSEQSAAEDESIQTAETIWDDTMTYLTAAVAASSLALTITTIAYQLTGVWQPWVAALGIWTGSCLAMVIYLWQLFLARQITGEEAGFQYIILALSLMGIAAGSLGTLYMIGCRSLTRLKSYWTNLRYFRDWSEKGNKGRSAGANLVCSLVILGVIVMCGLNIAMSQ
ncbi:MAG: hypothetical protein ACOC38_02755 [Promethearchaeia archaeon]